MRYEQLLKMVDVSDLRTGVAWCMGLVLVVLACLLAQRTSLRARSGALRIVGSATLLVFGIMLTYPSALRWSPPTTLVAELPLLTLLAVLVAVAGVATALVVVHQQRASTLRWPLAALCLGSALTSIHYLGNAILGIPVALTAVSMSLTLSATTLLGWAALTTAFPRMYLRPSHAFIRYVLAAMLLCAGTTALHASNLNVGVLTARSIAVETVGAVAMLTLIVSALTLLAMILDRQLVLQRDDLIASQQLHQAFYEGNPDAVFTLNVDGRFLSVNKASATVLGQRVEQLLNQPFDALLEADERSRWHRLFESVLAGATQRFEVRLGVFAAQTLEVTHIPLLIDGLVIGAYGVARNTTPYHATITAMESMEARYRSAFEYAPTGMALVAPSGRYVAVNRSLSQLLGYSEPELLAMSWLDLTPPEAYEAELSVAKKMLSGEVRVHRRELRFRHKQGHVVWAERRLVLTRDANYEPLYFICEIAEMQTPDKRSFNYTPSASSCEDQHARRLWPDAAARYTLFNRVRAELDGIYNALTFTSVEIALVRSYIYNSWYRNAREHFWAQS